MGSPDYAAALDCIASASPGEVLGLLRTGAGPLGATDLSLYLADFQGVVLQPMLLSSDLTEPVLPEEDVVGSMAGRAFRTAEPVTAVRDGAVRVWVPLVERAERTGVLALTLPHLDERLMADRVRLGLLAGLLVRSFARTTDLMHLRRRRRPMTLAAGMQWDLLPPLTVRGSQAVACGRLEPAYAIAGDAFDYVINTPYLDAAVFDGMGYGAEATMLATLAMGAYRHSRRGWRRPGGGPRSYRSGACRPIRRRGVCHRPAGPPWVGHRTAGVDQCRRSGDGEEFGVGRLVSLWEQYAGSRQPPEETLRRLVESVTDYSGGSLRDDATFLLLSWHGPSGPDRT